MYVYIHIFLHVCACVYTYISAYIYSNDMFVHVFLHVACPRCVWWIGNLLAAEVL